MGRAGEGLARVVRAAVVPGAPVPGGIIAHCGWRYVRFLLGFREVEELMPGRDVLVSHETVRRWCVTFGQACAAGGPGPAARGT
ncbi:hypothetical protein WJ438_39510 [Streptomyces sp. GD-15H]|uniref:hypothetical protein n=1 Tax=Streptomyces sp. GD-15H TaxID=3129112 RepID=UPI00324A07CB